MKINLLDHIPSVSRIQNLINTNPKLKINELSIVTYCPIVVTCYIYGLLYGFTDQLRTDIKDYETFYKCEVINFEEMRQYVESRRN